MIKNFNKRKSDGKAEILLFYQSLKIGFILHFLIATRALMDTCPSLGTLSGTEPGFLFQGQGKKVSETRKAKICE